MAGQGTQARLIPACFLPGLTRTLERAHCSILIHNVLLTLCSSTSTLGMDTGPRREYVDFPSIDKNCSAALEIHMVHQHNKEDSRIVRVCGGYLLQESHFVDGCFGKVRGV